MSYLLKNNILSKEDYILDYGCGFGKDITYLKENSFKYVWGYDKYIPNYSNRDYQEQLYSQIYCFYVLNTIENNTERIETLQNIYSLLNTNGTAYIAVRSIDEFYKNKSKLYIEHKDGIITTRHTFQKYFSRKDIEELIQNSLTNVSLEFIKYNKYTLFFKIRKEK